MTEALENSEELLENSQQIAENEELSVQIEKRGRGRPKGSVDKAPRKRTKIIEEAVEPPAPAPAPAPPPPIAPPIAPAEPVRLKTRRAPAVAQPAPTHVPTPQTAPAPLSPRSIFKQASETIYQLQSEREHARRQYWASQIEKSLR